MRYAFIFLTLGVCFIALAVQRGGWAWLLLWPGISSALVGTGYAGLGARVFGKRSNGRYVLWAVVIHLPYLLITLVVWHLLRIALPENAADAIAPGIWVARRPLRLEIPPDVRWIVDVTAEFFVATGVRSRCRYICYPTLDGHVCDAAEFAGIVRDVAALEGGILIHCAQGHGRSAALAAALLIARGVVDDLEGAERLLITSRPKVRLKPSQRALVKQFAARQRPAPLATAAT
jgi:protein-tyrosine phosphatase